MRKPYVLVVCLVVIAAGMFGCMKESDHLTSPSVLPQEGDAAMDMMNAVSCSGNGCNGLDPEQTGCAASAITVSGMSKNITYKGQVVGLLELRWSTTCKTNWTRVTRTDGQQNIYPTWAFVQRKSDGKSYDKNVKGLKYVYTPMVYASGIPARAQGCIIKVGANDHQGTDGCASLGQYDGGQATTPTPAPNPVPAADVLIANVPHLYQGGTRECPRNLLCAYASGAMLAGYRWGGSYATYDVMHRIAKAVTGSRCPGTMTYIPSLIKGLKAVNPASQSYSQWITYDSLKQFLRQGTPVELAVQYSQLGSYRCSATWTAGHAIVVIGFSEANRTWTYRDPLCTSGTKTVPDATFRKAVDVAHGTTNDFEVLIVK